MQFNVFHFKYKYHYKKKNRLIQTNILMEKISSVNYNDTYWQNVSSLCPLVYINDIFPSIYTKGITVVNKLLEKEKKWRLIITNVIIDEINSSLISVGESVSSFSVIT